MRLGVFGGTFDPVHLGHLILAEQCREQARLDQVWFIPAARPPHKSDQELTSFAQRVEMLSLAVSGNAAFRIDEREKDRPGPSFTVDTFEQINAAHEEAELFLMIGSDTLRDLPTWREPLRILELAGLLVAPRLGAPMPAAREVAHSLSLPESYPLRYHICEIPHIDISSRDLRRRAHEGLSLRYLMPRAVEAYIADKGLYRTKSEQPPQ